MIQVKRSLVDPDFLEVVEGDRVFEIKVPFRLWKIPTSFANQDALLSWLEETEERLVKNAALKLVAMRSYSKRGLLQKLLDKKFSLAKCQKMVERCQELGYVEDSNLADAIIREKIQRGYGPLYIAQVLKKKGLEAGVPPIDLATQRQAIQKWHRALQKLDRKKQIAFLLRKGFGYEVIKTLHGLGSEEME